MTIRGQQHAAEAASRRAAADSIAVYLEAHADRAGETAWLAALAMIERAATEAREGKWSRWKHFPAGELRRLRRDLAAALELARLAVAFQDGENDGLRELSSELHAQAEAAGAARRRNGNREAERVRRIKARVRREHGRDATPEELYGPGGYHGEGPLPEP